MKHLILSFLLSCTSVLQSQGPSSLTVRHLHEGGWSSHVIELAFTADALLLSGTQTYSSGSGGPPGYCIFPAEIRLERIVAVDAKNSDRNWYKIFSATSNSHTMMLHVEYRDEHGAAHSYDYISSDAQQQNNEWVGGNQAAVRDFAGALKYALALREQRLLSTKGRTSTSRISHVRNPITGNEIEAPALPDTAAVHPDETPNDPTFYKAQICASNSCRGVTVWSVSPVDPARLRVVDDITKALLVDIPHKNIAAVKLRQQVVQLRDPPPPGKILEVRVPLPLISPGAPKVYQLCLQIRSEGGKHINQCFVSDLVSCRASVACEEGKDGGRHMLDLERHVKNALKAGSYHR